MPHGLPLDRTQNHNIDLLPHSQLVNIKLYRCPQYQHTIMTRLIAEMLQDGIILPNTNPFSSLVLLVDKKYGS